MPTCCHERNACPPLAPLQYKLYWCFLNVASKSLINWQATFNRVGSFSVFQAARQHFILSDSLCRKTGCWIISAHNSCKISPFNCIFCSSYWSEEETAFMGSLVCNLIWCTWGANQRHNSTCVHTSPSSYCFPQCCSHQMENFREKDQQKSLSSAGVKHRKFTSPFAVLKGVLVC